MGRYLELTKPRITCFILMSTAIGFVCGMNAGNAAVRWTWVTLLHTLVGTALIASGTAALNQWYERDADAKMNRTMARPIPSGRVTGPHALLFGIFLSIAGFLDLWLGANLLTALLGLVHAGQLLVSLYADEAALCAFHHARSDPRRHASAHRIRRRQRHA